MAAEVVKEASGLTDPIDQDDLRNPDSLPTTDDPTGTCPRCGRVAHFTNVGSLALRENDRGTALERVTALQCQGCKLGTAVIEVKRPDSARYDHKRQGILWWPTPNALIELSEVPNDLASAFEEGARCVSVQAPHAAVAMFRNALAHIVRDKGSDAARKKSTLNEAVKQMVADKTLYDAFDTWATRVRTVGNAGAHQESWEEIPIEQAQELQDLTGQLIDFLYIQPARFARMMPPTKRPKA